MDSKASALDPIGSIDRATDKVYLIDVSAGTSNANTINSMLGISSAPLGTSDTQLPTNKTFDSSNIFTIRDDRLTIQDNSDATKQAVFQASGITTGNIRTYTLPDRSSTLATLGGNQTFTGVITASGAVFSGATISNPTLTVDAINEYTSANGVNIDGLVIKDGLLPAGNIQPLNLVSGTGASWMLQSWNPTFTNLSVGNGVVVAKYIQVGKTVIARLSVVFGSTTSISGDVSFSLPVTAAAYAGTTTITPLGKVNFFDASSGSAFPGTVGDASTTVASLRVKNAAGTYTSIVALSSTIPITWTTSDEIGASFSYEAA